MKRGDCLEFLASRMPDDALVATSLSVNTALWSQLRPQGPNFMGLNMGLCTPFALGMSLAFPKQKVIALDSDGSLMIDTSALITVADAQPKNLLLFCFDNEYYARMGPTPTSRGVDLERIAQGAGIRDTYAVRTVDEFQGAVQSALDGEGPSFILAKVERERTRILGTRHSYGQAMRAAYIDALYRHPDYSGYGQEMRTLPKRAPGSTVEGVQPLELPELEAMMGYSGLREFLDVLEQAGELARVRVPVALDQELGAVCVKSLRSGGPALLFERPGESSMPILTNLLATRRRYGLALGCGPTETQHEWNRRVERPIPPILVDRPGPCQEVVLIGDDADVTALPAPTWNALDGGPYLTLSCHITRDPSTGLRNVGVYRNQVHDKRTLGLLAGPYTHIMLQRRKAPDEPFPVAIVMGVDPRLVQTACSPLPFGTDEMEVAGALRGAPLELVRCKTIPLEVPADAEVVIEGEVRPTEKREEGPFGEFTGHYGGPRAPRMTIHVKAITRRREPIMHLAYQGAPPHETDVLTAAGKEAEVVRTVALPGIKAVHITEGGCGVLHVVVSVEKLYEGYGKMVGMAVLSCPSGRHFKQVTVVDEDVDPFDSLAVEWAVATRVQAARDVEILREVTGIFLDPSLPPAEQAGPARSSKMIIDATRYDAKSYPPVCLPSAEAMAKVQRDWDRYGIGTRVETAAPMPSQREPVLVPMGADDGPRM